MSDGFQHITVTPEPEEDTVIYAGLRAAHDRSVADGDQDVAAGERALEGRDSALADAADVVGVADAVDAGEVDVDAAVEVAETDIAVETAEVDAAGADTAETDAASDAEDDLTLEDLESPMPLKQRIVIIAVVICLIGAIAYCLAFMR